MLKSIEQTESRIKELLEERRKEITEREAQLEESRKALTVAEKNIDAAIDSGDTKAYQKAKAEKAEAEDAIELREKRLDLLKKQPLINQAEYDKRCQAIISDLDEMTSRQQKEAVKIVEGLKAIYEEANEEIGQGNEVLARWQHEVYRDADRSTNVNGQMLKNPSEIKRYTNFDVTSFVLEVLHNGYYKGFNKGE